MYADDSKILNYIDSVNDCNSLQHTLNNLSLWSEAWGLKFNPGKCSVLSFTRNRNKILFDYSMKGNVLNREHQVVDLGIIVNDTLKWDDHIHSIVNKANKRLGLIKRCVGHDCSKEVKLTCYRSLVRPLLESGSICWSVNNKKLLLKLESVQRRSTKYVLNNYELDYDARLKLCDLLPLTLRRDFLDLVFFYNHLNDLCYSTLNVNFVVNHNIRTRQIVDELMLMNRPHNTMMYAKFYTNRIVKSWNKLPLEIRNIELTEAGRNTSFKGSLKKWLVSFFYEHFDNVDTCSWVVHCGCQSCRLS
jgi:hypothetical protein